MVCIWIRSMVVMITEAGGVFAPIPGERRLVELLAARVYRFRV